MDLILQKEYSPSWFNRLLDWVDRLPVPAWFIFLSFLVFQGLLFHLSAWQAGLLVAGHGNLLLAISGIWNVEVLFFADLLDKIALSTLTFYRPLLKQLSEKQFKQLSYQFRVMPRRPVLLLSIIGFLMGLFLAAAARDYLPIMYGFPILPYLQWGLSLALFWVFGYRVFRQLGLMRKIFEATPVINIYFLDPIYVFSRLALWTSFAIVVIADLNILIVPALLEGSLFIVFFGSLTLTSFVAFLYPMAGVNQRISREKSLLLNEVSSAIEETYEVVAKKQSTGQWKGILDLSSALGILHKKREYIESISTWPWRPSALAGIISAILVPLLLRFIFNFLGL